MAITYYIKDGVVKPRTKIIIKKDGFQIINPSEEQLFDDGWVVYVAPEVEENVERQPSRYELIENLVVDQYNARTDIPNNDALANAILVYEWSKYIGKTLKKGQIVSYNGLLYRVIQDINVVLENHFPSIDTAALYEVIDKEHDGTVEDPIPYNVSMEVFEGKYYVQDDITYLCTRSSGVPLNHNIADLIGHYFNTI